MQSISSTKMQTWNQNKAKGAAQIETTILDDLVLIKKQIDATRDKIAAQI